MPHTPDHARRLMRELAPSLPGGAGVVLDRQKYWDPGFAELFFEYTEDLIFREPQPGLEVAETARRLAHAIAGEPSPAGRRAERERLVKAYGLLGTAYRAVGRPAQADRAYQKVLPLCLKSDVSPPCRVELFLRLAFLRACQKQPDAALSLIERAKTALGNAHDEERRGLVEATRGTVLVLAGRFAEAAAALGDALGNYRLSHRVEYTATGNLAHAVSQTDDPGGLEKVSAQLRRARQLAGPRRSVQKSTLYWIEGRIHVRRGSTERAERNYRKALQGFIKFQTPYEIALVGLDMSSLFRFSKRWTELEELAADTYRRFRELQEDAEALAALKLWLEAAQARSLTIDMISETKAQLAERMRSHPPAAARHG